MLDDGTRIVFKMCCEQEMEGAGILIEGEGRSEHLREKPLT